MDKEKLFAQIKGGLIVSCQALETEPLYTKEGGVMPLMAKAAAMSGAVGIRANTVRDITQIKQVVDLPVIGIIKKDYPGTPMYITVTMKEVDELVACGVDILAVQGTGALRPDGSTSAQFIRTIKAKYPDQLVMATTLRMPWPAPKPVPTLWAPPCAATPRRQKALTISTLILSISWPQSARQRSLPRATSTTRSRRSRRWKPVHSHWWWAVPSPARQRSRPALPVPSTPQKSKMECAG